MILKTLMEEKQLDFNQPLLSVRRFSSTVASENDNKSKPKKSLPKRPPLPFYKSELKSGPVSNPGTVPFVWEKSPGRPKNESKLQTQAVEQCSIAPKLPPGRVLKVEQQDSDKVTSVTQSRTGNSLSDSQHDGDETYLDAQDTLSRTESFFMSCSVSGLSEWDEQEVQPSGSFSTDQQARDFMIGRFLPAAKAMASETPQIQHNTRKPLVTQEQPRQVRKLVSGAKPRPVDQKWQKVLPHYAQDVDREESEDESDDNDGYENYAPKVCGLFPRFCLLNPVPGLRMEDRILSSTVHGVQSKSVASHRRSEKEVLICPYILLFCFDEKNFLGTAEKSKHGIDPHRRGFRKPLASESTQFESICESPVVEKTLYVDSVHKVKSSCSSDTGIDKNLSIDSSIEDRKHCGIVDEKAVVQPKNSASLDSLLVCSDHSNDDMLMEMKNHSNKICHEKQDLTKSDFQGSNLDHELVAMSSPEMVECKKIESESKAFIKEGSNCLIPNSVSWRDMKLASHLKFDSKGQLATKMVDQEGTLGYSKDPRTLASSKGVGDRKIAQESQSRMKLGHGETSNASALKLPLALPSPKAPSESWLKRTLPAVSSRNIALRSNLPANFHAPTQTPNWETVVRSSKVNHGHHRQFAEELLPPIPEA
uniref:DUF688 domain-containing protein n=1 Tax=Cajanus cajan TaxID=3821 RepID=A0A151RTM6_CAJCA|nr:hypothetical protein KK1_032568 [Cajanus cajan]